MQRRQFTIRTRTPVALSSARATPFPFVQPGLHVADAHAAASDRVDDLRWRLGAARVPRAATPLGVEAEQTTAERVAAGPGRDLTSGLCYLRRQ